MLSNPRLGALLARAGGVDGRVGEVFFLRRVSWDELALAVLRGADPVVAEEGVGIEW